MKQQQFDTMKSLLKLPKRLETSFETIQPHECFDDYSIESKKRLTRWLTKIAPTSGPKAIAALVNMDLVRQFNALCECKIVNGVVLDKPANDIVEHIIAALANIDMSHTSLNGNRLHFLVYNMPIDIVVSHGKVETTLQSILFRQYRFKKKDVDKMMAIIMDKITVTDGCLK